MQVLNKAKLFWQLDASTKLMFIEAFILLGYARYLKSLPFSRVAPSLGQQMIETSLNIEDEHKRTLQKVSNSVNIMSRYTLWESQCLVKAIAAMKMLQKRNIESTIYFGTSKDDNGKMVAHAWLRSGPYILTGAEGMEKFVVVNKFARIIRK